MQIDWINYSVGRYEISFFLIHGFHFLYSVLIVQKHV